MSYDFFSSCEIGTVKELCTGFGLIRFAKCTSTTFLVEIALKNDDPFTYSRFTQVMSCIEASVLFDKYSN